MHEAITLQVGQCGNQVGNEFWKRIAEEHNIDSEGRQKTVTCDRKDKYFYQTDGDRYIPRAVLIDLEPRVINQCASFFSRENIFIAKEGGGAGNNWSHGHSVAHEVREDVMDVIQREAEACECLESLSIMHSVAGGTGSGFGSFLAQEIRDCFSKKIITSYAVLPSNEESSDVVVQPYNSVLTLGHIQQFCDSVILMDNHALGCVAMDSERTKTATFNVINSLIAGVVAFSNATIRFPGHTFCSGRAVLNCTVPVPGYKALVPSFTPFVCGDTERIVRKISAGEVIRRLFLPKTRLARYEDSSGHLSLAILNVLEGVESSGEVSRSTEMVLNRRQVSFVPWMPPFFHVALVNRQPFSGRVTGLALNNTTGVSFLLGKICSQFDMLRKKNAFIEIYKKFDANLAVFDSSREIIQQIIENYQQTTINCPI